MSCKFKFRSYGISEFLILCEFFHFLPISFLIPNLHHETVPNMRRKKSWTQTHSGLADILGCQACVKTDSRPTHVEYLLWHYISVTTAKEVILVSFTDLDFADDVSLPAEMLEVLVLALTVMQEEASTFGLHINWSKIKILHVPSSSSSSTVQVVDGHVEVVEAFAYVGCIIDSSGGSTGEVLRQIGLARSCMNMLDRTGGSRSQASGWKPSYVSIRHTLYQF